ncbi:CBS domain-containing protein CBSX5-like [Rutidosis leptorrhynchoides]|uniref:CBS domain-containing protein CBSX5-like n=1 Tax=Rutidosis leptorrhynchoides TaxID=125765 RepID=UPI003A98DBC2
MAARLLAYEVSDLCLGKPPLTSLPITATIRHALNALKTSDDTHISIWTCDHPHSTTDHLVSNCRCIGKICMVDIICYLCKQDNISSPSLALKSPVSVLLSHVLHVVKHVEPSSSLLEAIDLIINGAQNLVVPIRNRATKRKQLRPNREYCWITQEDVMRFLLSTIGSFSPIAAYSVESLGIITVDILTINYHSSALQALDAITSSLVDQTSVAVVDDDGVLIGEISPFTLAYCDEMVAAAITTLSAGDLMTYIDCGGPPENIIRVVETRLNEMNLNGMLEEFSNYSSNIPCCNNNTNSSSEDELEVSSPTSVTMRTGRYNRPNSYSVRIMRRVEPIICHPGSSLVAVMIQAIAHRVSYVWVIEDDCSVVGIVKFSSMLEIFRKHLESMIN